jgi:alpha-N-arabinofuranosidase
VTLDEWNNGWHGRPEIYGEAAPRYFFQDALNIAMGLHEIYRNSDLIFMANTHPVNVHGHIKTTPTDAAFEVTGLAWMLYRQHFGTLPITISRETGSLDVSAAWTEDHQHLTVAVVNPTQDSYALTLDLQNAQITGAGRWWTMTATDPLDYNEPGQPPRVVIEEQPLSDASPILNVPPMNISLYELPAQ